MAAVNFAFISSPCQALSLIIYCQIVCFLIETEFIMCLQAAFSCPLLASVTPCFRTVLECAAQRCSVEMPDCYQGIEISFPAGAREIDVLVLRSDQTVCGPTQPTASSSMA